MEKIRFGILGTAKIAVEKVIPAMHRCKFCDITAIASRNKSKALEWAGQLNIGQAIGSYDALLADNNIDAVYIPLPNHLHVPWSIKALQAGKHVLCEKPVALNKNEALELLKVSQNYPNLKIMEAFMYRFHPQWKTAKQLVDRGEIGQLRTIQSFFSYFNEDPSNIRNKSDIGCYCISLSRYIFGIESSGVWGMMEYDPVMEIDRLTSGVMDFGSGSSTFSCSTQLYPYQRVNIFGTTGRIEIEIPFNAPVDLPCKIWHQKNSDIKEIVFEPINQYTIQGDAFACSIINNTPVPTPLEDAVANMNVIDALRDSAKSGKWELLS
jgi:predicted dehydrogenase